MPALIIARRRPALNAPLAKLAYLEQQQRSVLLFGLREGFEDTYPAIIRERLSAGLGVVRPDKRQRPNIRRDRSSTATERSPTTRVLHLVRHDGPRCGLNAD